MKTQFKTNFAFFAFASLMMACGVENDASKCNECRQQNAPLHEATQIEASLRGNSNLEVAPSTNVDESELSKDAGIAPSSLGDASKISANDKINAATAELLSKQLTEI